MVESLALSLLLEDLEESENETLWPGVRRFPSEVLGRCQRCDIFAALAGLNGGALVPCLGSLCN